MPLFLAIRLFFCKAHLEQFTKFVCTESLLLAFGQQKSPQEADSVAKNKALQSYHGQLADAE